MSSEQPKEEISSPAARSADESESVAPEVKQLRKILTSLPAMSPYQASALEKQERLSADWARVEIVNQTATGCPDVSFQQLADTPLALTDVVEDPATPLEALPTIVLEDEGVQKPELRLLAPFAKGGMGLIRDAVQLPLKRSVAVKQILSQRQNDRTIQAMLQEAWITGMLEHPNIVPVHSLGRAPDGAPMLVMKRIEGARWSDVMFAPKHPLRKRDTHDHLEWNFGILMQVCNAVHFAHSKGILHRDLKPDNVMIGSFGEIYLLDWGLSLALPAATNAEVGVLLPQVADVKTIAGTPSYMAPEMAVAAADLIDERTDVYLLGAILHEIIVAQPRHLGSSSMEILTSALYSRPFEYGEKVPDELVEICNKAMHVDPEERYQDAEEFRMALELFLHRRHAIRLSRKASRRLQELQEVTTGGKGDGGELHVHGLFRECRFGFRESLRVWEGNEVAIEGLQTTIETMITCELERGDAKAARTLFGDLLRPNPALQAQLDTLQSELDAKGKRVEALEQLKHDLDIEVGKGARSWAFLLVGVLCGLVSGNLLLGERMGWFHFNYTMYLASGGFVALCAMGLTWAARQGFYQNRASRRVLITGWVLMVAVLVHPVGCMLLKTPPHEALIQQMLLFSACIAVMAAMQDLRLFAASIIYLIAYLTSAAIPTRILEVMTLANFLGPAMIAMVWRPGAAPHPLSLDDAESEGS